jgi:hypothetical protein
MHFPHLPSRQAGDCADKIRADFADFHIIHVFCACPPKRLAQVGGLLETFSRRILKLRYYLIQGVFLQIWR